MYTQNKVLIRENGLQKIQKVLWQLKDNPIIVA